MPMLPRVEPKPWVITVRVLSMLMPPVIPAMQAAASMAIRACTRVRMTRNTSTKTAMMRPMMGVGMSLMMPPACHG